MVEDNRSSDSGMANTSSHWGRLGLKDEKDRSAATGKTVGRANLWANVNPPFRVRRLFAGYDARKNCYFASCRSSRGN